MRTSAITAALLALSISGTVNANDDFDALLADLSFGDAAMAMEPTGESLTVVQEETLQDLMPLPSGFVMPGMLESTPESKPGNGISVSPDVDVANTAEPAVPQVALMDPIPVRAPGGTIDFEDAFTIQESGKTTAAMVSHLHGSHMASGDCGGCNDFGHGAVCRPRNPVHLPSSTLYQYFRSHPCYTNVWDGYGIYCGSHHKHLHGECDCFKNKGHGCCGNQEKCDAAGCR